MHPIKDPWDNLSREIVRKAAFKAIKGKRKQKEVINFLADDNGKSSINKIYEKLLNKEYKKFTYQHKVKYNFKKRRFLTYCNLELRIVMHVLLILGNERYQQIRLDVSYNCIKSYGINAKNKAHALNHKLKHDIYESKSWGWMQMDVSKCYPSTNGKILKSLIHEIYGYGYYAELLIKASICEFGIPIGTPLSPFIHHLMMFKLDRFIKEVLKPDSYRRYADDMLFTGSKEMLHQISWRIRNFAYYECGYLIKRNVKIRPFTENPDIGGYVYHKLPLTSGHNKGYTTIRKNIKHRAIRKPKETSYFGIMKYADAVNLMRKRMDFNELVDIMIIERDLDSPEVDIKEFDDKPINVMKYDLRPSKTDKDGKEKRGWIKIQFYYKDSDGVKQVRCIKGSYPAIIESFSKLEAHIKRLVEFSGKSEEAIRDEIFPIRNMRFTFDSGWIIKGTNKQVTVIK